MGGKHTSQQHPKTGTKIFLFEPIEKVDLKNDFLGPYVNMMTSINIIGGKLDFPPNSW